MKPTPAVVEVARACPLLTRARAVATFVGAGRPVTAKAVLRRADMPAACAATGLPDPGPVVTAPHVRWMFAERLAGRSVAGIAREWELARGAGRRSSRSAPTQRRAISPS
jgi:hypothetical protein